MKELPEPLRALLKQGDPAHDVTPKLVARVSERLETDAALSRPSLRPLALGLALLASAALGAAGTVGVSRLVPGLLTPKPAPSVPTPKAATPDPLAREAALLEGALEALNRHDTNAALTRLDERARLFPNGSLETEARVLRVRVLLERGDDGVLGLLESLPAADVTPALRLSWARRLVERGDCAAAVQVTTLLDASHSALVKTVLAPCEVQGPTP